MFYSYRYRPTLHGILDELTHKMEGRPMQRTIPEPTKTKPFSLTASKERFPSPSKPVSTLNLVHLQHTLIFNLDSKNGKTSTTP